MSKYEFIPKGDWESEVIELPAPPDAKEIETVSIHGKEVQFLYVKQTNRLIIFPDLPVRGPE